MGLTSEPCLFVHEIYESTILGSNLWKTPVNLLNRLEITGHKPFLFIIINFFYFDSIKNKDKI